MVFEPTFIASKVRDRSTASPKMLWAGTNKFVLHTCVSPQNDPLLKFKVFSIPDNPAGRGGGKMSSYHEIASLSIASYEVTPGQDCLLGIDISN
jgi:hypothetical protein